MPFSFPFGFISYLMPSLLYHRPVKPVNRAGDFLSLICVFVLKPPRRYDILKTIKPPARFLPGLGGVLG
jgi:hypothetical protein